MARNRGFTLIELVTLIVILGVVGVGLASFVRSSVQIYVDVGERQQLLGESRFALERLKRELRMAVPNSIRITGNTAEHCIEFVPINWGTLYTRLPLAPSTDNQLTMVMPQDIDGNRYPLSELDEVLVYPRQTRDVYDPARGKRRQIVSCSAGGGSCSATESEVTTLDLTVSGPFAEGSPVSRLYLVDHSVNFCLSGGQLLRFENTLQPEQSLAPPDAELIAEHLVNTLSANPGISAAADDPFKLFESTLQRNAVVQIRLLFAHNDESLAYQQEVHIANAP